MSVGLNRRIHPRSLTDERGTMIVGSAKHSCVIRDRSQGGARLVLREKIELPARFDLVQRSGTQSVEIIWSDRNQVGVRFTHTGNKAEG